MGRLLAVALLSLFLALALGFGIATTGDAIRETPARTTCCVRDANGTPATCDVVAPTRCSACASYCARP